MYVNSWEDDEAPIKNNLEYNNKVKGNYRNFLFQITPKLHSTIHKECKQTLNVYKQVKASIKLQNQFDQQLESIKINLEEQLRKLSISLEIEKQEN